MASLRKFIFDDEAVVGIRTPLDYPYLKMLRFGLSVIHSWPIRQIKRSRVSMINSKFDFLLCILCLVGEFCYIYIHKSSLSFLQTGDIYISILMVTCMVTRITSLTFFPKYGVVATEYLTKFHLFFYKDRSDYAMKIHKEVHQICHNFTLYLSVQMVVGVGMFNFIPMYSNYVSGKYKVVDLHNNSTFEHSLHLSYPFNASTNIKGYLVAYILNWILTVVCGLWFITLDLFLSLMVFHLWGHLKILLHNLNSFQRPSKTSNLKLQDSNIAVNTEMFSENELHAVYEKLKECINYHREIKAFTDSMSDVFGPMLFTYYLFHQTSGCLLLLECSQMTKEALGRYLPLTIISFQQLIQLSVIFELIGSTSDKLKHALYGVPWECMDMKNRKIVAFFLLIVQEPIHVKALGVVNVGVTSMATILKTSFSFFTFLRNM